jgi:hypothetical protein
MSEIEAANSYSFLLPVGVVFSMPSLAADLAARGDVR